MNKSLKVIIGVMIAVVIGGGVYLWKVGGSGDDILKKLDPASFDVSATCNKVDGNLLVCNKDNDTYLVLDGVKVYREKVQTVIDKDGNENKTVSYKNASLSEIESESKSSGNVSLKIWLTSNGKVKDIMIVEETYQDENESRNQLDGLNPANYTSENVALGVTQDSIRLAPANYNAGDPDKFAELIKDYKFAIKTVYCNVDITITEDENGNEKRNIRYSKSSYEEFNRDIEKGKHVYIWLTRYGNVYGVMTINEVNA